jgi:cytoskeletal protein CcmA (bactofilin family)
MAGNEVTAVLGKGSEFEGKLTFDGTVRIDGKFRGEIYSEDTLIVGESAVVEAAIDVSTVIVYGHVIGNVHARNCIELHAPARLEGNIVTADLQVDKGVFFNGQVKMAPPEHAHIGRPLEEVPMAHPEPRREAPVKSFSVIGGGEDIL